MTAVPPLSACIVAMNEADRIGDCIASLDFCDEILVVDSHSSDETREVAAAAGARVVERDWPGHVAQKEFAIREARHDWVLCIDADERVSPALRDQITALQSAGFPEHAGWRCPRRSYYLGAWIEHGWTPDWQLRLFDRQRGRWAGSDPHDRVDLDGSRGDLNPPLLHHPYRSLGEHLVTIDRYTTTMAEGLHARGRRAHLWQLFTRPMGRFLRFYLLKRGFLMGGRGLLLALLAAHYVGLKYAKLWMLQRSIPFRADERDAS